MNWRILGAVWVLPAAIPIWVLFVLPAWGLGLIGDPIRRRWVVVWAVYHTRRGWSRLWSRGNRQWYGIALPFAVVLNASNRTPSDVDRALRHELHHCDQWLALGSLFPVVYWFLWVVYGYERNPLEVDARKAESP